MAAEYENLCEAINENLKERGIINKLECILRAEMFESIKSGYDTVPTPSQETRLINELIRDYLRFNGYGHTLSVFKAEANLPLNPMERSTQAEELEINDRLFPKTLPLIYGLALKQKIEAKSVNKAFDEIPEWKVMGKEGWLDSEEGFEYQKV